MHSPSFCLKSQDTVQTKPGSGPSPDIETHRLKASGCEPSRILLRLLDHTRENTMSCRVIQGWIEVVMGGSVQRD